MQVRRVAQTPIVENAWARGQTVNLHGSIERSTTGCFAISAAICLPWPSVTRCPRSTHRVLHPSEPVSALRRQAAAAFEA